MGGVGQNQPRGRSADTRSAGADSAIRRDCKTYGPPARGVVLRQAQHDANADALMLNSRFSRRSINRVTQSLSKGDASHGQW
jgi:hypothetical protein